MVWVYDRTASVFVAMLMHVSITASLLILNPLDISGVHLKPIPLRSPPRVDRRCSRRCRQQRPARSHGFGSGPRKRTRRSIGATP
jgi:hypothetical protein